jgi:hypothetical protein
MVATTIGRVPEHTAESVNERIREKTREDLARLVEAGRGSIDARLRDLEAEWDIERALEATAATVTLVTLGLSATVNRKFAILPGVVAGFLLMHAIQGWCPPLPVFRRLGLRTQAEIDEEWYALRALRGDFRSLARDSATDDPDLVLGIMRH